MPDRPDACIQVQSLSQGHVKTPKSTAHRSGQRPFYDNASIFNGLENFFGQMVAIALVRLFSGRDFPPMNATLPSVGPTYRCVEYRSGSSPDVWADPIPFNESNNRVIRNLQPAVGRKCDP
jgi:hypothetical protein